MLLVGATAAPVIPAVVVSGLMGLVKDSPPEGAAEDAVEPIPKLSPEEAPPPVEEVKDVIEVEDGVPPAKAAIKPGIEDGGGAEDAAGCMPKVG